MNTFQPDYHNLLDAAHNRECKRTPLYEHSISAGIMERVTGRKFKHLAGSDWDGYFKEYSRFFLESGYDTVTFEACITDILPNGGALAHPRPGYIDSPERFYGYDFSAVKDVYVRTFDPMFAALTKNMPKGMKAVGGVGNGIFEIVQDLSGFENLCILSFDEPEVYAGLFQKAGDIMVEIWTWFLKKYGDAYCVCRFGDDLGYKLNTMLKPDDIKNHIIPQYKRVIDLVHQHGKPFLLHSCGCIFSVMEELIAAGIDAKHSNEDQIADYKIWVDRYGDKIGNFGGIDTDHLVRMENAALKKLVTETYEYCHKGHGGFALGSGNSIPDYVDPEKYMLMVNTVRELRGDFR